jgi:2-desacetyl-2-hydroxyethyl bacteriochlorophyllide A dehydrogenase
LRSLVCIHPGLLEYKDIREPVLQKDHVLLKIKRIGICGTDLHAYEGTQPYFEYPRILGHELAAEVMEVNQESGFNVGENVTVIPYFACGNCGACRSGKPNCCMSLKVCGVHIDGGMVEYLSVPEQSLIHGKDLSLDALALIEPLAIGAHAVQRAGTNKNDFVLVIGAGPIGLAIMEFARIAGAEVIVLETNENRLKVCASVFGFMNTINAKDENVKERLMEITHGDMPGFVFDATGNLQAINNAFELMAHGGKFILVGLQKEKITFSHPEFHKREATVMSSRNATKADFEYVMACFENGLIKAGNFITHHTMFEKVKDEFASWLNAGNGVIKAMVNIH